MGQAFPHRSGLSGAAPGYTLWDGKEMPTGVRPLRVGALADARGRGSVEGLAMTETMPSELTAPDLAENEAVARPADEELARQLWTVGDAVRLRILRLLPTDARCEGGMNVSQLAEALGLAQPTISHHLRLLRLAGIVRSSRQCRDVIYYVDGPRVQAMLAATADILLNQARP